MLLFYNNGRVRRKGKNSVHSDDCHYLRRCIIKLFILLSIGDVICGSSRPKNASPKFWKTESSEDGFRITSPSFVNYRSQEEDEGITTTLLPYNHPGEDDDTTTFPIQAENDEKIQTSKRWDLFSNIEQSYKKYMEVILSPPSSTLQIPTEKEAVTEKLHPITQLAVPESIWKSFQGNEFDNEDNLHEFTKMAFDVATSFTSLDWKADSKTQHSLTSLKNNNDGEIQQALLHILPSSTVLIWSGKLPPNRHYHGDKLPIIKSRGIVHGLSPYEIAALLMDSTRVKLYNKISLGRTDVTILQPKQDDGSECNYKETKIVCNRTKPPLVSKMVEFYTMMHARPLSQNEKLNDADGYVVVSRAVAVPPSGDTLRSEILLGVNVLRSIPGEEHMTDLISVTHVNSPFVHPMIAGKVGLKGAADFLNDIRALVKAQKV